MKRGLFHPPDSLLSETNRKIGVYTTALSFLIPGPCDLGFTLL